MTLRVIALDPSKGKDAKFGDYAAFVMLGCCRDGILWCDAVLVQEPPEKLIQRGLELHRRFSAHAFGVETNQFQELLAREFARVSQERGLILPLCGINNQVNKEVRIPAFALQSLPRLRQRHPCPYGQQTRTSTGNRVAGGLL